VSHKHANALSDPLVRAADAIAAAASPALATALMDWAEILVERLDARSASALSASRYRLARLERRADISDRIVFFDPTSPD
jgi:hypothetical protein